MSDENDRLRAMVAEVAAAYFANAHVSPAEIPQVIQQIASSLNAVGEAPPDVASEAPQSDEPPTPKFTPAQIRKSITPDALISFEDGKPYRTLRRHLSTRGLTPDEYREKYGLPRDYPMVAQSYSAARSALAKQLGLGRKAGQGAKGRKK